MVCLRTETVWKMEMVQELQLCGTRLNESLFFFFSPFLGLTHIITMDLHQKEIQGFFSFPVDNLRASPFLIQYIQEEVRLLYFCVYQLGLTQWRCRAARSDALLMNLFFSGKLLHVPQGSGKTLH